MKNLFTTREARKAGRQSIEVDKFYGWLILIIGLLVISVVFNIVFLKRLR